MIVTESLVSGLRFARIHTVLTAVVLALGLAGIPGTGLAQTTHLRGSAERLTNDLINLHAQSERASLSKPQAGQPTQAQMTSNLLSLAQRRYQLLGELMEADPGSVLAMAIPRALRAGLPPGVQAYMEEDVQIEGLLEVLHEDRTTGGRYLYFLQDRGKRFSLHFAARAPQTALTGDRVRVKGLRVQQALALASADTALHTLAAAPTPNTFGPQRTVVFLINFQNHPVQPYTLDYARNVIFNTTSSFYRENSFQQTWLVGDVFGWYTSTVSSGDCRYLSAAIDAHQAAQAAGIDLSTYDRFIYALAPNGCPWWGLGTVGGTPSRAWVNGDLVLRVAGHEMGHNFGLYHSHALECGAVTLAPTCTRIEYGDTLDIMGGVDANGSGGAGGSHGGFNAFQKELLGWLGNGQSPPITTVAGTGIYTLDPLETMGSNAKALKIESPAGSGVFYYVEYRQPVGFDDQTGGNANITNGVVLHRGSRFDRDSSYLLDLTPSTASWMDPALEVGRSFTDPFSALTISTVWANGNNAGVSVAQGPGACVRATPTVTISPSQNRGPAGSDVSYTALVTNNDGPGCAPSGFTQKAAVPASTWTPVFALPTLTLGPGATASTVLRVTSPASASGGTYPIAATSTNSVAPTYAASASATYVVTVTPGGGGSFTDSFDRADSTTLDNGWVEVGGDLLIQKNQLRNPATRGFHRAVLPALAGVTQTAAASFASVHNDGDPRFGLILRYRDPGNYYLAYRQVGGGSFLRISKVVNGVETVLKSVSVPNPTPEGFFRISAGANDVALTVNLEGVRSISVSDSTFTGGSVGILVGSSTAFSQLAKSHRADSFSATAQ